MSIQVSVYIDRDLKTQLEKLADDHDMSRSSYMRHVLEQHVEQELTIETSRQVEAEQRIEELVAEACDEITRTTDQAVSELQAQTTQVESQVDLLNRITLHSGMYSIGTWRLISDDYAETRRKNAMQEANDSLQATADQAGVDLNALGSTYGRTTASQGDDEWYAPD